MSTVYVIVIAGVVATVAGGIGYYFGRVAGFVEAANVAFRKSTK